MKNKLSAEDIDRIIGMAWEDRTPFDVIKSQFGVSEKEVIKIMRTELKRTSFNRWRKRVSGRKTKHSKLSQLSHTRFKSKLQREITNNKISKR